MKRALGYILVFAVLTACLAACNGNMGMREDDTPADLPAENGVERAEEKLEKATEHLVSPTPDVNDGIVNDDNGIITEEDNGPLEEENITAPKRAER